MARLNDILLDKQAWAQTEYRSLDLRNGGMFGWMPDLREIHSWQQYVQRNGIFLVLETPRFFNYMPHPEIWRESYRCLVEKHAKKISGWKAGLKVSITDQEVGGAGEILQIAGDVKRERTEPSLSFTEKEGRPIQRMLELYIRYAIMDPDTKTALISSLMDASLAGGLGDLGPDIGDDNLPKDWLLDWFGGTVLAYETDITNRYVDKAAITTNFWPQSTGDIKIERDLNQSKDKLELDIDFTGVTVWGYNVVQVAQKIHDSIKKLHTTPHNMPVFIQDFEPHMGEFKSGYIHGVHRLHEEAHRKDGGAL